MTDVPHLFIRIQQRSSWKSNKINRTERFGKIRLNIDFLKNCIKLHVYKKINDGQASFKFKQTDPSNYLSENMFSKLIFLKLLWVDYNNFITKPFS